jgi:hypothetical protein
MPEGAVFRRPEGMAPVKMSMTRMLVAGIAGIALAASGLAGTGAAGAARAWPTLAAPAAIRGVLDGVAATSAENAWAVGCTTTTSCAFKAGNTLILRWNGKAWKRQASPSPEPGSQLSGVAATAASNAWAVGYTGDRRTLILHWNGRVWKRVPSPDPLAGGDWLLGVAALSARSAWAVGYGIRNGLQALVLRWNGRKWKPVPSPVLYVSELSGVAVTSARSAWAVGSDYDSTGFPGTLAEHWNGKAWQQVAAPDGPKEGFSSGLNGVAASSGDVWAVGSTYASTILVARWTGSAFKKVASPASAQSFLAGVAATSAANAWAVGGDLILRWHGKTWKPVPSASPGTGSSLNAVAATSARNAWAVGSTGSKTLILRWNGKAWKRQASPGA